MTGHVVVGNRQLAARARDLADDAMRTRRAALCVAVLLDSTTSVAAARKALPDVHPDLRPLAEQLLDLLANEPEHVPATGGAAQKGTT